MRSGTVVVVDAERTKEAELHVKSRLENGKCLACKPTPKDPLRDHKKRGLCDRCHARWLRVRSALGNEKKRGEYDALLIQNGRLLQEHEISELKANNVFTEAAAAVSE